MNVSNLRLAREKWPEPERGRAARKFRERLGLTVAQVAQLLGCSKQTIFTFERGETNPSEAFELKLVNTLITELAERRARPSEEAPLEAVYGPVNVSSFSTPEVGPAGGSEAYRHVLAYAARCEAAAAELAPLAEKARPRERSLISAFKRGLEAEAGAIREAGQKTMRLVEAFESDVHRKQ